MFPIRFRALTLLLAFAPLGAAAQEFRAMWADTFHAGLRNSTETSALIAAARAANCNAVVVEVRKRGDAYYRNGLEPVATDVAAGFDPLADLIQRGHSGTPRVEVHAWIVTYNIWNNQNTPPTQATHPFNLHPEWLSQNHLGTQFDGSNYQFDPGHPAVQQHTFDVAMDIISRYDIDGFHFDYIRYSDSGSSGGNQPWGYNPVAVARFKAQTGATGTPAPTNTAWLQWRRDQVTALVRKIYLNARALKPNVRISAALICYGNAPANLSLSSWQSSEAYARVLQDWRGWMQEGILDLACPMVYGSSNTRFSGWANFLRDRQYNRAGAMGMGWYLNAVSNTIDQIGIARSAGTGSQALAGIVGFSYAVPNSEGASQSSTWSALSSGPFPTATTTPAMPWKSDPGAGSLMGFVQSGAAEVFDGATVMLSGPVTRTLTADATGFFGVVDIPPGNYTVNVTEPGYRQAPLTIAVAGGSVTQAPLELEQVPFQITSLTGASSPTRLTVTWNSIPGRTYRVEGSGTVGNWSPIASGLGATGSSTSYQWAVPGNLASQAFIRIIEE